MDSVAVVSCSVVEVILLVEILVEAVIVKVVLVANVVDVVHMPVK